MVSSSVIFEYFCAECTDGKWIAEKKRWCRAGHKSIYSFQRDKYESRHHQSGHDHHHHPFSGGDIPPGKTHLYLVPSSKGASKCLSSIAMEMTAFENHGGWRFLSSFACLFVVPYPGSLPQLASVFLASCLPGSHSPGEKRWWGELFEASTPWLRTPWFFSDTWTHLDSQGQNDLFHCFRAWVCAVGMPRMSRWFLPADGILGCFGMFLC